MNLLNKLNINAFIIKEKKPKINKKINNYKNNKRNKLNLKIKDKDIRKQFFYIYMQGRPVMTKYLVKEDEIQKEIVEEVDEEE